MHSCKRGVNITSSHTYMRQTLQLVTLEIHLSVDFRLSGKLN
jgi:hypothetical protein